MRPYYNAEGLHQDEFSGVWERSPERERYDDEMDDEDYRMEKTMKVPRKQYTEGRYFGRSGDGDPFELEDYHVVLDGAVVGNWFSQDAYGAAVMENERLLRENEQLREQLWQLRERLSSWKAKADDRLKIIRLLQAEVKLAEVPVPPVVTTPDGAFPNANWARRAWPPSPAPSDGGERSVWVRGVSHDYDWVSEDRDTHHG